MLVLAGMQHDVLQLHSQCSQDTTDQLLHSQPNRAPLKASADVCFFFWGGGVLRPRGKRTELN